MNNRNFLPPLVLERQEKSKPSAVRKSVIVRQNAEIEKLEKDNERMMEHLTRLRQIMNQRNLSSANLVPKRNIPFQHKFSKNLTQLAHPAPSTFRESEKVFRKVMNIKNPDIPSWRVPSVLANEPPITNETIQQPISPILLDGEYNEEESRLGFQEALMEWRKGSKSSAENVMPDSTPTSQNTDFQCDGEASVDLKYDETTSSKYFQEALMEWRNSKNIVDNKEVNDRFKNDAEKEETLIVDEAVNSLGVQSSVHHTKEPIITFNNGHKSPLTYFERLMLLNAKKLEESHIQNDIK